MNVISVTEFANLKLNFYFVLFFAILKTFLVVFSLGLV